MPKIALTYRDVPFELADEAGRPCWFVYGVRKSGSSIFNSMVHALAMRQQLHWVDVPGDLFKGGVTVGAWQGDAGLAGLLRPGNVYGGFRNFPAGFIDAPLHRASPKVLLVRDPRDALVSEYFSNAYSHSLPAAGDARSQMLDLRREALQQPIEDYVLARADAMTHTLEEYLPLLADPLLRVFRYEDVIARKRVLLTEVGRHFGWAVEPDYLDKVLSWADQQPAEEDPTRFVRKVTPGDHLDKLRPDVIRELDRRLAPVLGAYGYAECAVA
jgi:hypothetical protein